MKFYAILLAATASSTYAAGGTFFDAGSSGTKVLAYEDAGNTKVGSSVKFTSKCNASPFQGNSAFGVEGDSCTHITTKNDTSKAKENTAEQPQDSVAYGKFLATMAHLLSPDASNKGEMPALATAGNRIISKKMNDKIWGTEGTPGLCGQAAKDDPSTKIAPIGEKCGTIPGTREALFEHVAFHVEHAAQPKYKQDHRALFTSGGASAQISIPIYKPKDKQLFLEAVARVTSEFAEAECAAGKCKGIKTPGGKSLPYFTKGLANETANAAGDFIRFWSVDEIKAVIFKEPGDAPRNLPFKRLTAKGVTKAGNNHDFLGLATISFIGLAGTGGKYYRGVAGGVNQIEEWAKQPDVNCSTPVWKNGAWTSPPAPWSAKKFDDCLKLFEEDLRSDVMWEVTTKIMQTMSFANYKISYGTASIQPKALLINQSNPSDPSLPGEVAAVTDSSAKAAYELIAHDNKQFGIGRGGASIEQNINTATLRQGVAAVKAVAKAVCTKLGHGFGYNYENTCAKAFWVYKYLSLGLSAPEERQYMSTDFGNANVATGASKSDRPVQKMVHAALTNVYSTLKVMSNHLVNMGIDLKANMKTVPDADFGDADVAKGAAFSFKAKGNLRKRQKQEGTLQAGANTEAHTEAQMHALGMHILNKISLNRVNYMKGVAHAV